MLTVAYYVRQHNGQPFVGGSETEWIGEWLKPDSVPQLEHDPIGAIRQGFTFNLNHTPSTILKDIFGSFPVPQITLEHFAKYPMRMAFGVDPWDLLQGYIRATSPEMYFTRWAGGARYEDFLNHTERIFYLTRGYGVPNPNISESDLLLRKIYMKVAPTALIALSDIFEVCATRQDPDLIREQLTCYPLVSIDHFHQKTVEEISDCLEEVRLCSIQSTCSVNQNCAPTPSVSLDTCTPERVECYKRFLDTKGIISLFEYDPHFNVFVSNISQLDFYRTVIPGKTWDPSEVLNMHPLYVRGILNHLPDYELLKIGAFEAPPEGLESIDKRLRSVLLRDILDALLIPRWIRQGNTIIYGRAIDTPREFSLEEFIGAIRENEALIDPAGNVLDYESAIGLEIPEVNEWVYRTQVMEMENKKYRELSENMILWAKWEYPEKWIPVSRRLKDGLIPDSLKESTEEYYRQIFHK